jgi:hypothetical protein
LSARKRQNPVVDQAAIPSENLHYSKGPSKPEPDIVRRNQRLYFLLSSKYRQQFFIKVRRSRCDRLFISVPNYLNHIDLKLPRNLNDLWNHLCDNQFLKLVFQLCAPNRKRISVQSFLRTSLGHAARWSINGAIHYVCEDWRHQRELIAAGEEVYSELKNLCVWNKTNAGMGSLYRSKHELIFVFKVGKGAHINNVALGRYGRHRTNVWDYVSQNALNGTVRSKLALHPTVKPVAMIADAIRDCSNRGGLILDPFGGAGTTLIAAERTSRRARVIEVNPIFVDVSIERWQRLTGRTALHADSGQPFVRSGSVPAADISG